MTPFPILLDDSPHGFYRAYCVVCGEPMRVTYSTAFGENWCEDCGGREIPPFMEGLTPSQKDCLYRTAGH